MDPLERLVALEEVRRLKARYFEALDGKRWSDLEATFAPDGVMDLSEEMNHHGGGVDTGIDPLTRTPKGIVDFVRATVGGGGDRARGPHAEHRCLGARSGERELAAPRLDPDRRGRIPRLGHYHDSYVRDPDAGWLIESTRITRVRVDYYGRAGGEDSALS